MKIIKATWPYLLLYFFLFLFNAVGFFLASTEIEKVLYMQAAIICSSFYGLIVWDCFLSKKAKEKARKEVEEWKNDMDRIIMNVNTPSTKVEGFSQEQLSPRRGPLYW